MYNESYYNSNNYHNYSERAERYHRLARELVHLLDSISLIDKNSIVFDYGCAFGFLLEGFKDQGITAFGYDISEYARNIAKERQNSILDEMTFIKSDLTVFMDVLEHMTDEQIIDTFTYIDSNIIICRIPCGYDSEQFYLEISRNDPGHINCKKKDEWKEFLGRFGYTKFLHLNLNSIYDSKGVFSFIAIK